ncbi:hypothetical protein JOQ06_017974 [Pogonophryne albipinna]|uniref:Reverse transcriptase domain-containing protein n=1 Tax=Pogonophryne albipinna TaxID=1090488 RepID=A0AAD6AI79_9TELE|nr:hypothetical protein JOQ06_017974 [Pogonophryne albipinna]
MPGDRHKGRCRKRGTPSRPALTVISVNIEGFSSAKQTILADLCSKQHCDVLCLQETQRGSENNRPTIPGMVLAIERPHRQYGSAIFVKTGSAIEDTDMSDGHNIEVLSVELSSVVVTSVYKPPPVHFVFSQPIPKIHGKPQIVIGDFNSHSTQWGYPVMNKDGEAVEDWMDTNQLSLIHDPKLPHSLFSARWKRGYNPDLTMVTSNIAGLCKKTVLDPIPSSQHRPIGILINAAVVPTIVPFKRRFNYKKADWKGFTNELEEKITNIIPVSKNYDQFANLVLKTARKHIPRGCRVEYILGLSKDCAGLYDNYVSMFEADPFSDETTTQGEKVMESIAQERSKTWNALIKSTDMSKNSKKAWALIHKLRGYPKAAPQHPKVTANQVANKLLENGKSRKRGKKTKLNRKKYIEDPDFTRQLTMEELEGGISILKPGKAIGLDTIATEQIKHFGHKAKTWLLQLYNECLTTHKLPNIWKKAHIIALLKPGKEPSAPKNFRPISLLSHTYKLFERLILNRIGAFVDEHLIPEQAGFRPGKSTTSQVLNLSQYIEDRYEEGMVTGAVFVDLSAAYDTVNHRRLLSKILETTRDTRLTELIESMLENRHFFVELGGKKSKWRRLRNGLPQGSVLAPLLFNIYTNDQPKSVDTRRFIYADDLGIGAQATDFKTVEDRLSNALAELTPYYEENHLRANPSKTQVCAFHLRNREAKRQLKVSWSGTSLEHSAEYACPVWERAAHAKKLDPALNASCRIITGCLKSTPTDRLYILAGIAPPEIRRNAASKKERQQQSTDQRHPLFGLVPAKSRLKSRKSFLKSVPPLGTPSISSERITRWEERLDNLPSATTMELKASEALPPGADTNYAVWKCLNRIRSGVGRAKATLAKCGYLNDGDVVCDCGIEPQTMQHLLICPLLEQPCTTSDLAEFNEKGQQCVQLWLNHI